MALGKTVASPSAALVGSVNLASAKDVFTAVGGGLRGVARRIPDGETGDRSNWFMFQIDVLRQIPGLEELPDPRKLPGAEMPQMRIKEGADFSNYNLPPLGYAANAVESYKVFSDLKKSGAIASETRMQVSLPTPIAPIFGFLSGQDVRTFWPIYERAMLREVAEITRAIPAKDLAIQWDFASEILILESGDLAKLFTLEELVAALQRVIDAVPTDVEVGVHLCYGDPGVSRFGDPKDTSLMVKIFNLLFKTTTRKVNWIQLPVPDTVQDEAFYAPLQNLDIGQTELYLGIIHLGDGIEGARKRIAAAKKYVAAFGVATECGWARRPRDQMPVLVQLHAEASKLAA